MRHLLLLIAATGVLAGTEARAQCQYVGTQIFCNGPSGYRPYGQLAPAPARRPASGSTSTAQPAQRLGSHGATAGNCPQYGSHAGCAAPGAGQSDSGQ